MPSNLQRLNISGEHQGKRTSVKTTETSKLPCGKEEDREETNSSLPTASENIIGLLVHCTLKNMLKSNHGTKVKIALVACEVHATSGMVTWPDPD